MKPTNAAVTALLNARPVSFHSCDLYTIATVNGPVVRLCTADFDAIDLAAFVYSCGAINSGFPKIDLKSSRVTGHSKRGLDSDTWVVALAPTTQDPWSMAFTYPDVVGGTPWFQACRAGLFDGAAVTVQRAYYAAPPVPPYTAASRTCVGTITIFAGIMGAVDCTQTVCRFTLNDYKYLLGMSMPRNLIQPSCRHALFDTRCTLAAASYAANATALYASARQSVIARPAAPAGSGTYQLGRMLCTSGANGTFQRTIAAWDGVQTFQPNVPWPFPIAAGDGFTFWPGCDKSLGAGGCGGFANKINFGGMPRVPVPEIQIG